VVPGSGHNPHYEFPAFVTPRIMDRLAAASHPALNSPQKH